MKEQAIKEIKKILEEGKKEAYENGAYIDSIGILNRSANLEEAFNEIENEIEKVEKHRAEAIKAFDVDLQIRCQKTVQAYQDAKRIVFMAQF